MICENCENEHNESYGSGRFCSSKCARGFSTKKKRSLINEKVRKTFKKNISQGIKMGYCKKSILKNKICPTCKNEFKPRIEKQIYCSQPCVYKSEVYKTKMSKANKGKTGGYRKGSGNTKGGYYKRFYFDSPFEIEIAKELDRLNIKWIRNTKRFYFVYENKKTYCIPDFYIKDLNLYLETKGYWRGNKKEKTLEAVKQNNINWKYLMWEDWKKDHLILEQMILQL